MKSGFISILPNGQIDTSFRSGAQPDPVILDVEIYECKVLFCIHPWIDLELQTVKSI